MGKQRDTYGIPFLHWDLLVRIIPGAYFLTLIWVTLLPTRHANGLWQVMGEAWYHWVAFLLLSYLVGHVTDAFTWLLATAMGKLWYSKMRQHRPPYDEALRYIAAYCRGEDEEVSSDKAQVESRSLLNLSVLTFLHLFAFALIPRIYTLSSIARTEIRDRLGGWCILYILEVLFFFLSFIGGCFRQKRRIWGVTVLYDKYTESKADQTLKAGELNSALADLSQQIDKVRDLLK